MFDIRSGSRYHVQAGGWVCPPEGTVWVKTYIKNGEWLTQTILTLWQDESCQVGGPEEYSRVDPYAS